MSVKTAGVGHFLIPTAPAAGTSCTSGAANVFTTTYVQMIASTAAAIYITGVTYQLSSVNKPTYIAVQIATGGAGSETIVDQQVLVISDTAGATGTQVMGQVAIFPPVPVATATRIAVKTADSIGALATLITLTCINQSNVVDDGIAVGTVTTVTNQLTAAAIATGVWQDAVAGDFTTASSIGKCLFISNVAPGGSGGHMISGSNAGTTTLGALTVTGATTLTGNAVLSDGLTISAPSTLNRAGLDIAGNGTGAAIKAVAGATGVGFSIAGGGTSGDGIKVTTTSGHGMNLAPVGSSMHGLLATGGNAGTSDGIKGTAGTGGVDLRANITGNLTGNVTGSVGSVTGAVASVTARVTANTDQWAGGTIPAVNVTGVPLVDLKYTLGTISPATAGSVRTDSVTGAVGSVTGAVGSVTAAVTLPSIPANWITAAGINAAAMNGKGDWNVGKTGYSLTQTFPANFSSFTIAATGEADANVKKVNTITVNGLGTVASPWGP